MGGLVVRRERWGLSLSGKLLLLIACVVAVLVARQCIYSFLAITGRANGQILVVEGWIPTSILSRAAAECNAGPYQYVLVVRGVNDELGNKYDSGRYTGDYVANLLVQDGVTNCPVETLFFQAARKDRTYHSALEVKQWLAHHSFVVTAVDVITAGPHARRSRLLYEKAFGDRVKIGIVALTDIGYDTDHWWQTSEGVREVVGEALAYGYARFFFHPDEPK